MYRQGIALYKELEKEFNSKVLVYVTSDRANMEAQIAQNVIDYFMNQLDKIGKTEKISLLLYTRGGNTSATWNIVNLLRMYCGNLQVIILHKAHSAGTIISLGANEIVMTKQATLGSIDPSINTPLNPSIPNNVGTFSVSVESVKGYLEFAKNEMAISDIIIQKVIIMNDSIYECISMICESLPAMRDALGLTQLDFSRIIGISRQSVIDLEHKNKKITKAVLCSTIAFFTLREESAKLLFENHFYENENVNELGFTVELVKKIYEWR